MSTKFEKAPLVERLKIKISDEEKKKLLHWIEEKRSNIESSRNDFIARHSKYLANFDDFVTYNRKGPWENASNLHMQLTSIMVKTYHSRLYNIFTQEDTTQLIPREPLDIDHTMMLKKLRNWYMWDYLNRFRGIRGFAREVFYDTVTVGFGIGLKTWDVKQRKVIEIDDNELYQFL